MHFQLLSSWAPCVLWRLMRLSYSDARVLLQFALRRAAATLMRALTECLRFRSGW